MKSGYRQGTIKSNIQVASNIYEIKLSLCFPEASSTNSTLEGSQSISSFKGKPGQFYMVRGWEALDPFLSRPISISDLEDGIITFLYEVKGKGTHIISKLKPGDTLELLGPLGTGFDLNSTGKIAIISGGIGIAPMIYLAKSLNTKIDFYSGFRNEVYCLEKVKKYVNNIWISTENGSVGHKGFITEIFQPEKYDILFTCGPLPMMKEVLKMCNDKAEVYMSMEKRMACGIGACLGCTIKTIFGIKRVCKEGPVFSGKEVLFDD